MIFYLGTHQPNWLWKLTIPLFVSRRRLTSYKKLHRATSSRWCLDSGAFTEISAKGYYETTARQYADEAMRYMEEIGSMDWASPQDWMCEPHVIARTRLSISEHQRRTIKSVQHLRDIAPSVHWIPVLQGWRLFDYTACVRMYEEAGVDLTKEDVVGVGSVCRRQRMAVGADIIRLLSTFNLKLHAFGFKTVGLRHAQRFLLSSDSMAWSFQARYDDPLPGHKHKNCANCVEYALRWRRNLLTSLGIKERTVN